MNTVSEPTSSPSKAALVVGWEPPQCPFRIECPSALVEEVRRVVVDAFYSVPRGGVEIGGALFGTRESGRMRIAAWRPICCEHALGPSFVLSEKDRGALTNMLAEAQREPALAGLKAVGWFHSHTRGDLTPRPTDLELYDNFFGGREDVALILRPAHMESTRATFLFRNREGKVEPANCEEFAIDPASLSGIAVPSPAPVFARPLVIPAVSQTEKRKWGIAIWIVAALVAALVAAFGVGAGSAARSFWLPADVVSIPASPALVHLAAPSSVTNSAKDQIIEDLEKQAAKMRAELLDQRMRTKRLERSLSTVKKQLVDERRSLQ